MTNIPDTPVSQTGTWTVTTTKLQQNLRWTHYLNRETGLYDRRWWWRTFGQHLPGYVLLGLGFLGITAFAFLPAIILLVAGALPDVFTG